MKWPAVWWFPDRRILTIIPHQLKEKENEDCGDHVERRFFLSSPVKHITVNAWQIWNQSFDFICRLCVDIVVLGMCNMFATLCHLLTFVSPWGCKNHSFPCVPFVCTHFSIDIPFTHVRSDHNHLNLYLKLYFYILLIHLVLYPLTDLHLSTSKNEFV